MATGTDWLKKQVGQATDLPKQPLESADVSNSSQVERWLQQFDVKYSKLLDLPLKQIDVRASRGNQARPEALVPSSVERFMLQMQQGESFPPVVGYMSAGKVVLIDGNNREAAHRKAHGPDSTIPAYVIAEDTPSETIFLMMVDANSHHGETPDDGWRLRQALHLVGIGFTAEEACEAAAVKIGSLRRYKRELDAEKRAKSLNIKDFASFPGTTKVQLNVIPNDKVFKTASECARDTAMKGNEVRDFVRDIKDARDEQSQQEVVAKTRTKRNIEAKRRRTHGGRTSIPGPKHSLITGIGKVMAADPAAIAALVLTTEDRAELMKRCEEGADHLLDIMTALEGPGVIKRAS